jgi:hypothetical protein
MCEDGLRERKRKKDMSFRQIQADVQARRGRYLPSTGEEMGRMAGRGVAGRGRAGQGGGMSESSLHAVMHLWV